MIGLTDAYIFQDGQGRGKTKRRDYIVAVSTGLKVLALLSVDTSKYVHWNMIATIKL